MSKVMLYHTNSREFQSKHRQVYHDHSDCPDGKRIKPQYKLIGTGNKVRCDECKKLG